jgi:hypothetical protein
MPLHAAIVLPHSPPPCKPRLHRQTPPCPCYSRSPSTIRPSPSMAPLPSRTRLRPRPLAERLRLQLSRRAVLRVLGGHGVRARRNRFRCGTCISLRRCGCCTTVASGPGRWVPKLARNTLVYVLYATVLCHEGAYPSSLHESGIIPQYVAFSAIEPTFKLFGSGV